MKNTTYFFLVFKLIFISTFVSAAYANAEADYSAGNKLEVNMASEYGYDDNFLYSKSNEQSTSYLTLDTNMLLQLQFKQALFNVEADTSHYKFTDFSNDDHSEYTVKPQVHFKISPKHAFFSKGHVKKLYEYRGTDLTLGIGDVVETGNEKKFTNFHGGYFYGDDASVAKLLVKVGQNKSHYITNRNVLSSYDYVEDEANVALDYLLSDKTYLAFDFSYRDTQYDDNTTLSKEKYTTLAGIKWESSALTKLNVLLGYQEINFEDKSFANDYAFSWKVGLQWAPLHTVKVNMSSERDFTETNRLYNSYSQSENHKVRLIHNLTDYFQLYADIKYRTINITNELADSHDENYLTNQLGAIYKKNHWLALFATYEFEQLNANNSEIEYEKNIFSLGLKISLH